MMSRVNHALKENGAMVVMATSNDEKHIPENIIDGNKKSFWISTGLFPQMVTIAFPQPIKLENIRLFCFDINELVVDTAADNILHEKDEYEPLFKKELLRYGSSLQIQDVPGKDAVAKYLRLSINSGHHHFAAIHHVVVEGEPQEPQEPSPATKK